MEMYLMKALSRVERTISRYGGYTWQRLLHKISVNHFIYIEMLESGGVSAERHGTSTHN